MIEIKLTLIRRFHTPPDNTKGYEGEIIEMFTYDTFSPTCAYHLYTKAKKVLQRNDNKNEKAS